jgi:branched-chain amino acid transport system ATP-binding protein
MNICRDVDVTYDGTQVLFNVDFDVAEGELVALLGTNGAGKSTLLRAICGIQQASNGAVFLDGEDVTHKPPYENARDGIVFVPGGRAIFPTLSVAENLRAASWLYRQEPEYVERRIEEVLDFFPVLRERLEVEAGNMSGGEQQMLALGQAFLMRPRLLMIDELSLGLAPAVVERLLDIVRAIHAQGTTVILVEQSVNVALTVAERAVFMNNGTIRFDGPTEELLRRPDIVRSVFLGGVDAGRGRLTRTRPRRPTGESEEMLAVEGVSVSYGGVQALSDVSVAVDAREVVGIIGPNGAGKTTLFDVISGFLPADDGRVLLHGSDVTDLAADARARAGLVRSFQATRLFPSMTTRENLALAVGRRRATGNPLTAAAWLPGVRRAERRVRQRVDNLIDLFNLGAFADKFVNELSTGSRRLVDIACITAVEPKLLLLDEPSSGIAQKETEALLPLLRRLRDTLDATVLVIEHDMPLVMGLADRIVAMASGRVIADGTPAQVQRHPDVLESYLGTRAAK